MMMTRYTSGNPKYVIMAKIKTTISLKESLVEQADAIAEEMGISRNRLFSVAVEQFVVRYQNQKILGALNDVYRDGPRDSEQQLLHEAKLKYQQRFEDEW